MHVVTRLPGAEIPVFEAHLFSIERCDKWGSMYGPLATLASRNLPTANQTAAADTTHHALDEDYVNQAKAACIAC